MRGNAFSRWTKLEHGANHGLRGNGARLYQPFGVVTPERPPGAPDWRGSAYRGEWIPIPYEKQHSNGQEDIQDSQKSGQFITQNLEDIAN